MIVGGLWEKEKQTTNQQIFSQKKKKKKERQPESEKTSQTDTVWGEIGRNTNVQLPQVETRFQQAGAGREEPQASGSSGVEQDERAITGLRTEAMKAQQSLQPKVERSEISNTITGAALLTL